MNHALKKTGFRRVLGNLWYPLKSLKSVCSQLTVMLRSVKRIHRKELSFCAKQCGVPESIGELTNLEELRLQNNNLSILPDTFGLLSNLIQLYLNGNNLTELPYGL